MKLFKYILTSCIGLQMISCEDIPDYEMQSEPVVEAFLYSGETVDDIILKKSSPYNDENDVRTEYIPDADARILHRDRMYNLTPINGESGHYAYLGNDLVIAIGDTYILEFEHNGEIVHAETVIPPLPQNSVISKEGIYVPVIDTPTELRNFTESFQETIDISWDNSTGEYYYLLIENLEEDPEPINQLDALAEITENFEFISSPTQSNIFSLRATVHYNQYGRHRVTLYHVNEEYAQLYESTSQDSRDLSEPYTNIKNGLGIFTGFSSETFYFEVMKE
ncbi:DUF4249 family protein [Flagellimonas aurea]|uniref:DUF4249 family protein n=1 Tax=Flagellimonas aurea TaxID=2915619 RepID=UPI0035CF1814